MRVLAGTRWNEGLCEGVTFSLADGSDVTTHCGGSIKSDVSITALTTPWCAGPHRPIHSSNAKLVCSCVCVGITPSCTGFVRARIEHGYSVCSSASSACVSFTGSSWSCLPIFP